ncbi:hypothetical protein [Streptomyces sp. NPDC002853]
MTAVVLPYSHKLRLRPRRVTRQTAEEAYRVVSRHFDANQIADLRTRYPIRGAQDDEASSVEAGAAVLEDLLHSDQLTAAVPLGTFIELTNLTIAAQGPQRTVHIVITSDGVDIDIAGVDQDWVQARGRELRTVFTPNRRPWVRKSSFDRRDFVTFGIALDALAAAVLFAFAPGELLGSPPARITLAAFALAIPSACWLTAGRIMRRSRVRIAAAEPVGWWRSMDTMAKITLGLFVAAVLTLILSITQNGLTGDSRASFPPARTETQEDGIQ